MPSRHDRGPLCMHPVYIAHTTVVLNLDSLSCSFPPTSQSSVSSAWEVSHQSSVGLIPTTLETLSLSYATCEVLFSLPLVALVLWP